MTEKSLSYELFEGESIGAGVFLSVKEKHIKIFAKKTVPIATGKKPRRLEFTNRE